MNLMLNVGRTDKTQVLSLSHKKFFIIAENRASTSKYWQSTYPKLLFFRIEKPTVKKIRRAIRFHKRTASLSLRNYKLFGLGHA